MGYRITLMKRTSEFSSSGKFSIYVPIRNEKKTELNEEINEMIAKYNDQQKMQTLSAKFSWLRTKEEVNKFEKDYSPISKEIVENLVRKFKEKHQ